MPDRLPYCIQCGAQQINADAKFCHRCGQPIVPVKPGRGKAAPWLAPVLVSAGIVLGAAIVFSRLLAGGPAASRPAAATPAPPAAAGTLTPATAAQYLGVQVTPTASAVALMQETPTPPLTETLQSAPTLANITPGLLRLTRLAWSPDGKVLALGAGTGVYLYDTATWREARFIPLQVSVPTSIGDGAEQLAFSFDGALLATLDRIVQVWRVADGSFAYAVKASGFLGASPAEGLWATFGEDGSTSGNLRLWKTTDGQLVRTIATGLNFPFSMAFSSDGGLIAAGPMEGSAPGVWQVADGRRVAQLDWEMADVFGWADLAFRPNTTTIAAVGGLVPEAVLLLWDANGGAVARQLVALHEMPQGPTLNGVSYAPDGSLIAGSFWGSGDQESKVQLWGADGARGLTWLLPEPPGDIAFSPDGKLLAVMTGQNLYLYNSTDGSVVQQVEPIWRQGVLPTPTPTPLSAGLELPADWKEYMGLDGYPRFRLKYPPHWRESGGGTYNVTFLAPSPETYDSKSAMVVDISLSGRYRQGPPGDPATLSKMKEDAVERIDSTYLWDPRGPVERVFVGEGSWSLLIPGTYLEFDTATVLEERGRVRVIELAAWPQARHSVTAFLIDELEDIGDEDRIDLSRVLASIVFEDPQQPFSTVTPTLTPTLIAASRPALPLQISFDAKTSRSADGGGNAEITIEIKDAQGNPVNDAEVTFSCGRSCNSVGLSRNGRFTTSYGSSSDENQTMKVEIRWNQELIAQQDFVISWQ